MTAVESAFCDLRLSIIPAGAITDPRIEARDLQVLALLGRHTNKQGWCFRSQVKMAEELRCGRATVQRALERLYDAGWVERRLRSRTGVEADPKHPHAAHAYRVKLDRDDVPDDALFADADAAAETDSCGGPERGCPPVGTPPDAVDNAVDNPVETFGGVPIDGQGVPAQDGQGGAHAWAGTHGNDDSELDDSNRERDARARARSGVSVQKFLRLWPTAATDSRTAIEREWCALNPDEQQAALDGIESFRAELQRHKRSTTPAGATYLRERKWKGLPSMPTSAEFVTFAAWSKSWWAMILARVDRGEDVRFRLHHAAQGGCGTSELTEKMPPPEQIAALQQYPSDGDAVAAWRRWFEAKGAKLPDWRERVWVFLPGPEPPLLGQPALSLLHRGSDGEGGT